MERQCHLQAFMCHLGGGTAQPSLGTQGGAWCPTLLQWPALARQGFILTPHVSCCCASWGSSDKENPSAPISRSVPTWCCATVLGQSEKLLCP